MSLAASGLLGAHARHLLAELDDRAVVNHPVDGRRRGQRVLEDPLPFGKDQIGRNDDAAPFVPFGQEGKQHLHLFLALLHVANVIEDDHLEAVKAAQLPFQLIIPLGSQQASHQAEGGTEQNGVPQVDQFIANRRGGMRFARARKAEEEDVLCPVGEATLAQLG